MKSTLLRAGIPSGLCLVLGFYLGRQTGVLSNSSEVKAPQSQSALVDGGGPAAKASKAKAAEQQDANGLPPVFVGSADEFLKALFRQPGTEETHYLIFHTIQHTPLDTLISWANEVAAMPTGRVWQPQVLQAIGKRWAAADPTAALAWAQALSNGSQRKQAVSAILSGIARQDPTTALTRLSELPDGTEKADSIIGIAHEFAKTNPLQAIELVKSNASYQAQRVLNDALGMLTRTDPQAAMKTALAIPSRNGHSALRTVFNAWALDDPTAALAAAAAFPNKGQREEAAGAAMTSWALREPAAALAHIQTLPESEMANFSLGQTLGNLTKSNSKEALAVWSNLSASRQKKELDQFASAYAENDAGAALAWAIALPDKGMQNTAFQQMGSALQNLDPASREALIASIPDGRGRFQLIQSFISNQAYNDPVAAAKLVMQLDPYQQTRAINNSSLMHYLSEADPAFALQMATQTTGGNSSNFIGQALQKLAMKDFPKAETMLATLDPIQQAQALPQLYASLAATDGPAAMAKVSAISDKGTQQQAMQAVLSSWAQEDPDAVLQWAQNSQNGTEADRLSAQYDAITNKLRNNPAATLPAVNAMLQAAPVAGGSSSSMQNLSATTATFLFRENPQSAVEWINQLSQESHRNAAISSLSSQWASEDPVEASVWVRSLPAGTAKDGATQNLINQIEQSDPASAFAWAASIGESDTRENSIVSVFHQWRRQDPAAAAAALQAAPISETTRASLLQPPLPAVDPFSPGDF